jgi:hypothetical protein
VWGEGDFVTATGPYRFLSGMKLGAVTLVPSLFFSFQRVELAGEGLELDPSRCIKKSAYSIIIQASLDQTEGWRRVLSSKGWDDK